MFTNKFLMQIIVSITLFATVAMPVFAAGPSVVATWSVVDHGQGCWGGGNLLSDGTGNGGGGCAFQTSGGEEVASLTPVSWSYTDSSHTAVNLNAVITGKKGPAFPIGVPVPVSVVVPVGTNAPVNLFGDTYGKVTILSQ